MTDHPNQQPPSPRIASDSGSVSIASPPFAERAAKASCIGALAVYFLGVLSTASPLLWGLLIIVAFVAFTLGVLGVIGGMKQGKNAVIRMAILGAVLSGVPLATTLYIALGW